MELKLKFKNIDVDTIMYDHKAFCHSLNIEYVCDTDTLLYVLPISNALLNDKLFIEKDFENFIITKAKDVFKISCSIVKIELHPQYLN